MTRDECASGCQADAACWPAVCIPGLPGQPPGALSGPVPRSSSRGPSSEESFRIVGEAKGTATGRTPSSGPLWWLWTSRPKYAPHISFFLSFGSAGNMPHAGGQPGAQQAQPQKGALGFAMNPDWCAPACFRNPSSHSGVARHCGNTARLLTISISGE